MKRLFLLLTAIALTGFSSATEMVVKDFLSRELTIDLLGLSEDKVTFRRKGEPQEFVLPLDRFDPESREMIKKEALDLPVLLPKIEIDLSIGKRRQKEGSSYYMVQQDITTTAKVRNLSLTQALPPVTAKVIYFGQDRRDTRAFTVMAVRTFPIQLAPGATMTTELDSFETRYDSDSKGYGNIGGYQYTGYLLVLTDEKENIVLHQTTYGTARATISADPTALKTMATYQANMLLNDKLEASGRPR